ncbi:IE-1 [Mocis latipes granulovirus]|uniref:IE-1 n=1 Tax=Mocis latipes granulovirus TaxID=2072024 RepID=A0A162GWF6_9BBAC|nr:IE-1 [Mocis latipes granulovirus]AKR17483.1 IE-1 [Mocis latipes granulovirus]
MDEFYTLSNIDSQMQMDNEGAMEQSDPVLDAASDSSDNEDDSDASCVKEEKKISVSVQNRRVPTRAIPDNLLPFNKRSFVDHKAPSTSSPSHNWPAPNINTCRWISMYSTTSNHMVLCHTELMYVRNIRFGTSEYIKKYYSNYGKTYEVYINSVKLYITTTFLKLNDVPLDLYPVEIVEKIKDAAAISYLLNLRTHNKQTLLTQLILLFHSINLLSLSSEQIDTVHEALPNFVTHRLLAHMKKNYNWKSEVYKVSKIKTTCAHNNILLLFKASTYEHNKPLEYRKDNGCTHSHYVREFHEAIQLKNITSPPDSVTHVKWLFSAIVKSVIINPPQELFRLKLQDCTFNDIEEFLRVSKLHPMANVILHTRAPFTGKEHFRLNCFKLNKIHVWINSMVFDKDETRQVNVKQIVMDVAWGDHHIVSFKHTHNQKLKQMHMETVKLVIRYILERRNFTKLAKDVSRYNKISYEHIFF